MQKTFLFKKFFSEFFVSVGGNAHIGFRAICLCRLKPLVFPYCNSKHCLWTSTGRIFTDFSLRNICKNWLALRGKIPPNPLKKHVFCRTHRTKNKETFQKNNFKTISYLLKIRLFFRKWFSLNNRKKDVSQYLFSSPAIHLLQRKILNTQIRFSNHSAWILF